MTGPLFRRSRRPALAGASPNLASVMVIVDFLRIPVTLFSLGRKRIRWPTQRVSRGCFGRSLATHPSPYPAAFAAPLPSVRRRTDSIASPSPDRRTVDGSIPGDLKQQFAQSRRYPRPDLGGRHPVEG